MREISCALFNLGHVTSAAGVPQFRVVPLFRLSMRRW